MRKFRALAVALAAVATAIVVQAAPPQAASAQPAAGKPPMADKLILYGDLSFFQGRGQPENCILKSRYKRGEPVGFRMTAIDPMTGQPVESAVLVVHLTYAGNTVDVPMRYRGTGDNPTPGLWTAKWIVPDDAPTGIVRYTVTGKDKDGRTGEFKPFANELSQLTIVN